MPPAEQPLPRTLAERQQAAHDRLDTETQLWLATGSDGRGAHLIPVAYVWIDGVLVTATFEHSRTTANLRANPQARVALGTTSDVVMVDVVARLVDVAEMDSDTAERYAQVSRDPRRRAGFVYIVLAPRRVLVWNGFGEFFGRTVMLDGEWLDHTVD